MKWAVELVDEDHEYHRQFAELTEVVAACVSCSRAFGAKDAIEANGRHQDCWPL